MQAQKRRINPGVIGQLLDEPHRFGFFQAVRLLEGWFGQRTEAVDAAELMQQVANSPSLRDHPDQREGEERRRALTAQMSFRSTLSLGFPPSEIEHLLAYDIDGRLLQDPQARQQAIAAGTLDHVSLTPAFFGLLGVQGALPLHYTEQLAERETMGRDRAAREYLNIFSNRATALFYGAWKKYRLALHYESDRDERYLPYLLALGGVEPKTQRRLRHEVGRAAQREHADDGHFDEAIAGYTAALRQNPMSAVYLQRVIADYFGIPAEVEQFVGRWYTVPTEQLSRLGMRNATLGATALSGGRVWQRDMCARVILGPMSLVQYRHFLRGRRGASSLTRLLQLTVGVLLEFEIQLVLHKDEVKPSCLGAFGSLGQDAFMVSRKPEVHRRDARYALQVIADAA